MSRYKLTQRVAVLGIAANFILLVLKLAAGFLGRSQAMMADGFNSAGDIFSSVMTFIGNKIAGRPEDKEHPYGHGKAEYIFSMIISFSLLFVASETFKSALKAIIKKQTLEFSWWLIAVAMLTIVIKIVLFIYARSVGRKEDNLLVMANSEDHRNDIFVTSSTLLGIYLSAMGIYWMDGVAGIGISLWIAFTGIRVFLGSYSVLMDTNINESIKKDIVEIIQGIEGVDHVDDVFAKPVGIGYIVIVKVSVLGDMTVNEGHSIAARIRETVSKYKNVKDVVVHVNPA